MNWQIGFWGFVGSAVLFSAAGCFLLQRLWQRRFRALTQEVTKLSEDLLQMAELQMSIYRRVSRDLSGIEEKVLDLSVPSSDAPLPLERRHQVLTLARKGVSLDEIARRLNIPKGEAELILNLRKYMDAKTSPEPGPGALRPYAQATS